MAKSGRISVVSSWLLAVPPLLCVLLWIGSEFCGFSAGRRWVSAWAWVQPGGIPVLVEQSGDWAVSSGDGAVTFRWYRDAVTFVSRDPSRPAVVEWFADSIEPDRAYDNAMPAPAFCGVDFAGGRAHSSSGPPPLAWGEDFRLVALRYWLLTAIAAAPLAVRWGKQFGRRKRHGFPVLLVD